MLECEALKVFFTRLSNLIDLEELNFSQGLALKHVKDFEL